MSIIKKPVILSVLMLSVCQGVYAQTSQPPAQDESISQEDTLDAYTVWGDPKDSEQAGYTSPVSTLEPQDMATINMATTEDAVKYEPSLVIRRRFIGDSNGTLGMRGSNMFQTPRSMVFADGVPLHYLLESRWNGAPRWTMVSASEIARVDVMYGPFSAEYGGNSMGGVVVIETEIPQQSEFHADGMIFSQQFDAYGFDDTVNGYKGFLSYGNKFGNLSTYFSYNHLDNESQPQSYFYSTPNGSGGSEVSGGIVGTEERGNEKVFYGDSGVVQTTTDNYKVKLAYDFDNWFALLNVAYEDRHSQNSGNSYVQDANDNTIWSGDVSQGGLNYQIDASSLNEVELHRDSLNVGLRLRGELSDNSHLELDVSRFDILKDESSESAVNPADAAYDGSGEVVDYRDSGWQTAQAKLTLEQLGVEGLSLVTGLRHEAYELNRDVYQSNDHAAFSKDGLRASNGGESQIDAAFAQLNWILDPQWDISFGARYEAWQSDGGYYAADDAATPQLDLVHTPARSENRWSPKFSVGHKPYADWLLRYSLARAYRFPIIEELYSEYRAYNTKSVAAPGLEPEAGVHHNLMLEKALARGYVRVNFFREDIEDVIESQTNKVNDTTSVRTFVPIDEVETTGLEFIANIDGLFVDALDVRFNAVYTRSEIVRNSKETEYEGKDFPRMPRWRANLLATYHLNNAWDVGGSVQYASNSFGRLDNEDTESNVFRAQDGYTRLGLKSGYQLNKQVRLSFGADNLTNEIAYVSHPWPGRTFYLSASYDM